MTMLDEIKEAYNYLEKQVSKELRKEEFKRNDIILQILNEVFEYIPNAMLHHHDKPWVRVGDLQFNVVFDKYDQPFLTVTYKKLNHNFFGKPYLERKNAQILAWHLSGFRDNANYETHVVGRQALLHQVFESHYHASVWEEAKERINEY